VFLGDVCGAKWDDVLMGKQGTRQRFLVEPLQRTKDKQTEVLGDIS